MPENLIKISVILPCYNEGDGLVELIAAYRAVWPRFPSELILVDNGSTDNSASILALELAKPENEFTRTVRVEKNQGYGHGILTGLRAARGEFLAWSHADLQCAPEDVFVAFEKIMRMPDPQKSLIKGKRGRRSFGEEIVTGGMSLFTISTLWSWLTDINAQPKMFHRSMMNLLPYPPDGFPWDLYVLYQAKRAKWEIASIPVTFGLRKYGQSIWAVGFISRWRTILRMMRYILVLRFWPTGIPPKPNGNHSKWN